MPNRILKESICTSETIDSLGLEAEAFFYRLMVQCDDFGRMDARPSVLRARCFPLRLDKVTDKMVALWLSELAGADLLWMYELDGRVYLQVTTWDKHQQKRAKYSKFPQPPERASNGNQLLADASNSPRETRIREYEKRDVVGQEQPTAEIDLTEAPVKEPDAVQELAATFEKVSGVKLPNPSGPKGKATVGVTWWHPLREMVRLGNGTAAWTLKAAITQMRRDGLTIASPKSVEKVFISLHGAATTGPAESTTPEL